MADKVIVSGPSVGIAGLLTITFVVLKCLGHLTWSWWWVFSPLWISFGLGLLFIAIIGIIALIVALNN